MRVPQVSKKLHGGFLSQQTKEETFFQKNLGSINPIGSIYHLYTTYSPCQLGDYMLPSTFFSGNQESPFWFFRKNPWKTWCVSSGFVPYHFCPHRSSQVYTTCLEVMNLCRTNGGGSQLEMGPGTEIPVKIDSLPIPNGRLVKGQYT